MNIISTHSKFKNYRFGRLAAQFMSFFSLFVIILWPVYSHATNDSSSQITHVDVGLRAAFDENDDARFEELLAQGANPTVWFDNTQSGWVMCSATLSGKEQFLKKILQYGFDPNFRQSNITSELSLPLTCAIRSDNLSAIEILVEAGADLSKTVCLECSTSYHTSVLSEAVLVNKYDLALWIYQNGSFSNAQMNTVKRLIEFLPFPSDSPEFEYRAKLVESMKLQGIVVVPWNSH